MSTWLQTTTTKKKNLDLYRWVLVFFGLLGMLFIGVIFVWSIFVLPIEEFFGWSRDQTSMTFTVGMICFSVGMILGGRIVRRIHPRIIIFAGAVLMGLGLFGASFTSHVIHLHLTVGLGCGFGAGLINVVIVSTVLRWFPDKRGLVSGCLLMGTGFSGMILTMLTGWFLSITTWMETFRFLGLIIFGICLLCGVFITFPPKEWEKNKINSIQNNRNAVKNDARDLDWHGVLKTGTWWSFWFWFLMIQVGGMMVMGHIVPLAIESGISQSSALVAVGVMSVANGFGRLGFGKLMDHINLKPGMILQSAVTLAGLILLLILINVFGTIGLYFSVLILGAITGAGSPFSSVFVSRKFGMKYYGVNLGLTTTSALVASIVGGYIGGLARAVTGQYTIPIIAATVMSLFSLIISLIFVKKED